LPIVSNGQQESYFTLYQYNMNVINPAFAGAEGEKVFSFTSRRQWTSMEEAPSTLAFAYSAAKDNNIGIGISVVSDKVFIEQQTFAYLDVSYKLDMDISQLYLGIKAGGNFYSADPKGLPTFNPISDPLQRQLSRFNPNIGAGFLFKSKSFWTSFSVPRLFNVRRDNDLAIMAKDRIHAYLGGGANLALDKSMTLKPSLMFRKVKGLPIITDLTTMMSWKNQFDFGVSFRSNSAFSLISLISLGGFDIGYAYESTVGSLSQLNIKTHEIVLRIRIAEAAETETIDKSEEDSENQ